MSTAYKHTPLTPIIASWVNEIIRNKQLIQGAIEQHHSPINIHHLRSFEENITAFKAVFKKYELKHQVFFARKANKAISFVKSAKETGAGVDTASFRELDQALKEGVPPHHIVLTAAVKNDRLIALAVKNQIPITVDNIDECNLIHEICEELDTQTPILVRVSGFDFIGHKMSSRFGFDIDLAKELISQTLPSRYPRFNYLGLHFHLNGYSIPQRGEALLQCIALSDLLRAQRIETQIIDIGGGYLINYLSSRQEWDSFLAELKSSVLYQRTPITYDRDPLGMTILDGRIYGEPAVYPYYNEVNKARFLEEILIYKNRDGIPIHELIHDREIELRIEPGRSTLDQAGITVAKVAFRKPDTNGELLIGLEMNRTQLRSSSADFLLDPIHLPATEGSEEEEYYGYLVGAYCLEQEFILKRKIKFNAFPQIGDLIVFVNTAGYMMHFYESEAHLFELAKNLVYNQDLQQLIED
ncbi:Y4yA family PLP-dependent enzyme [Sphingobacterium olei]|uniref:Y4yA family PLP-dependent enzyme n=1 Tax=Sphingobacterium olei TaxID=2571155 RepID=A0A4U0NAA3_9SPHI|nr:Y4yA family PLP-dependent enzyme [Sphingobacterium olei]TJZ50583.1 Y4yA family PLP-dependent enzyme [Sphingobacterium olei]